MSRKIKPVLSFTEIARRTGMSLTTISKIYSGRGRNRRRPSFDTARKMAKAQGMSLDELYSQLAQIQAQR